MTVKAAIVEEVERLHWRLWNGNAKDAQISIARIRAVMHHFRGAAGGRKSNAPARKLCTALHALDGSGQPPDEQTPTDALVATRGRPAASGSLRHP
jgi:hypothetical protein